VIECNCSCSRHPSWGTSKFCGTSCHHDELIISFLRPLFPHVSFYESNRSVVHRLRRITEPRPALHGTGTKNNILHLTRNSSDLAPFPLLACLCLSFFVLPSVHHSKAFLPALDVCLLERMGRCLCCCKHSFVIYFFGWK